MFKRLFYGLLGVGTGLAVGVYAVQKVEAAQRALRPDNVARAAGARATGLRQRLANAVAQGRLAAAAKEAELRAVYRDPNSTTGTPDHHPRT